MTVNGLKRHLNSAMLRLRLLEKEMKALETSMELLERNGYIKKCDLSLKVRHMKKSRDGMIKEYENISAELLVFFKALPPVLQSIMQTHYISGKTWENIAELLDLSVRSVYRSRDKAIRILSEKH